LRAGEKAGKRKQAIAGGRRALFRPRPLEILKPGALAIRGGQAGQDRAPGFSKLERNGTGCMQRGGGDPRPVEYVVGHSHGAEFRLQRAEAVRAGLRPLLPH